MESTPLPDDVVRIAEYLAMMAKGYDNHLKWNEQAKFKADLMNTRHRWLHIDVQTFGALLRNLGMRDEDITELVGWLKKAQAGRRLVPHASYRGHAFQE